MKTVGRLLAPLNGFRRAGDRTGECETVSSRCAAYQRSRTAQFAAPAACLLVSYRTLAPQGGAKPYLAVCWRCVHVERLRVASVLVATTANFSRALEPGRRSSAQVCRGGLASTARSAQASVLGCISARMATLPERLGNFAFLGLFLLSSSARSGSPFSDLDPRLEPTAHHRRRRAAHRSRRSRPTGAAPSAASPPTTRAA